MIILLVSTIAALEESDSLLIYLCDLLYSLTRPQAMHIHIGRDRVTVMCIWNQSSRQDTSTSMEHASKRNYQFMLFHNVIAAVMLHTC